MSAQPTDTGRRPPGPPQVPARRGSVPAGNESSNEPVLATVPPETMPAPTEPAGIEDTGVDEDQETDRPWLVIVWNDPINLMSFVTYVLQKLFGYSQEKATQLMLDVHHKGRAVVSSGTRDRAELDVYRLHEHGLWATMEQSS
jgi:ATP-dependent Clp protease adaptor protein ClpS